MDMDILFFLVSFFACTIGSICGVGGGVIIRPILDATGAVGVAAISFLSGCTVLAMSGYSILRNLVGGSSRVDFKSATPLAIGAAIGGISGKEFFSLILAASQNANFVGGIQASCLGCVTLATLVYTIYKSKVRSYHVEKLWACLAIGLLLGFVSSFLGIGGGPIHLTALFLFFSMDMKTAAQNSLYIILFSQLANFITTISTHSVPEFHLLTLSMMIVGGIAGGIVGRYFQLSLNERQVDRLYRWLMVFITLMSAVNAFKYFHQL